MKRQAILIFGNDVTRQNGNLSGVYIVKVKDEFYKIGVK